MQIVCVSRGSYSRGKELAEQLAANLGYDCVSREELLDEAARRGIPVGKLEMAMVKTQSLTERLVLTKEHFQALATATLCERALKSSIVYHGRTGHLILGGIGHVLRIRAVADLESRIQAVMQRLNLSRDGAKKYVEQVEEDRRRWVKHLYNVDWDVASLYDMTVNLEHLSVDNAAKALCSVCQLPDFQETPATHRTLEDLLLASRARLALAENAKTCDAPVKVRATQGVVSVSYLPQHANIASAIPSILEPLEGARDILCTMANNSILWIQERFDPACETLGQLVDLAARWDAAIELLRFVPVDEDASVEVADEEEAFHIQPLEILNGAPHTLTPGDGGIEDDVEVKSGDESGLQETLRELFRVGCAGGARSLRAPPKRILSVVDPAIHYSLAVTGDLFLSKGAHVQKRLTRELDAYLMDHLKCPVVMAEELQTQYLFGKRQFVRMVGCFLVALVLYALVFAYQIPVLRFLSSEHPALRVLSVLAVLCLVPAVAYSYGMFSRLLLKCIRLE